MFSFVHSTGDGGQDKATQRKIRAHAMRDYRRRQRAEQAAGDKDGSERSTAVTAKDATAAWREHRQKLASQRRARKLSDSDVSTRSSSRSDDPSLSSTQRTESEDEDLSVVFLSRAMGKLDLSYHISKQTGMAQLDISTREELVPAYVAAMYPTSTLELPGLWLRTQAWTTPRSPGMQAAVDAVGLVQLGATRQSGRVLLDARKRNVDCIELLRRELPDPKVDFFGKQAAAHCLLMCEAYSLIGGVDQVWQRHVPGVVNIVASRGPRVVEIESAADPLAFVLFSTLRLIGFAAALIQRKAYVFGKQKWRRIHMEQEANELTEIMAVVTVLPKLLQQADELKAAKEPSEPRVRELTQKLEKLEHEVVEWMIHSFRGKIQFEQVCKALGPDGHPVSSGKRSKPDFSMTDSTDYPSYLTMSYRQLSWTCILLARRATLDLSRLLPEHKSSKEAAMKASVEDSVKFLCQCAPFYLKENATFAKACALSGLLYFARSWFVENDDRSRIAWADRIQETVQRQAPYLVWTNLLPWTFWGLMWFP